LCLFLFLLMVTLDGIGKVNRNHGNQYGQGGSCTHHSWWEMNGY